MGQQRIHHLCIKFKHAFNSRHPRTFVKDTVVNRSILDILQKEGFLSNVMYGDSRAPFPELISMMNAKKLDAIEILSEGQKERMDVLERMRNKIQEMHKLFGSDGSAVFEHRSNPTKFQEILEKMNQPTIIYKETPNQKSFPPTNEQVKTQNIPFRFTTASILSSIQVIPPVSSVYIPTLAPSLTSDDLLYLTVSKDRRLWADLRYDQHNQPALSDMKIVSKGSLKVHVTATELDDYLNGNKRLPRWSGAEMGQVTIIQTDSGELMTAKEALKRGLGGEVLCVAK